MDPYVATSTLVSLFYQHRPSYQPGEAKLLHRQVFFPTKQNNSITSGYQRGKGEASSPTLARRIPHSPV
jgi:hypothetical protein